MKDNGEAYRLGTLVVWVDDETKPLVAVVINLSVALNLRYAEARVGFTSSTGRAWEKHDVISWFFCEQDEPCVEAQLWSEGRNDTQLQDFAVGDWKTLQATTIA